MRDKAKEMYETGFGSLRKIAEELNISENTIKSWKSRDKWLQPISKKGAPKTKKVAKKKIKEIAKALIEEGHSIRDVAAKVGLPKSTVGDISSKNNLQQSQLEYLKQFREKYKERIEKNKLLRLETNEEALAAINYEIGNWRNKGVISKSAMEKLIMNEDAEKKILEIDRIDRLEKLEVEKDRNKILENANKPPSSKVEDMSDDFKINLLKKYGGI